MKTDTETNYQFKLEDNCVQRGEWPKDVSLLDEDVCDILIADTLMVDVSYFWREEMPFHIVLVTQDWEDVLQLHRCCDPDEAYAAACDWLRHGIVENARIQITKKADQ